MSASGSGGGAKGASKPKKPEAKPDGKTDGKTDAKPDAKADPKAAPKWDAKAAAPKTDAKAAPKPDAKPATKPDSQADAPATRLWAYENEKWPDLFLTVWLQAWGSDGLFSSLFESWRCFEKRVALDLIVLTFCISLFLFFFFFWNLFDFFFFVFIYLLYIYFINFHLHQERHMILNCLSPLIWFWSFQSTLMSRSWSGWKWFLWFFSPIKQYPIMKKSFWKIRKKKPTWSCLIKNTKIFWGHWAGPFFSHHHHIGT